MDIMNLIASIQLADLQRRGYFKQPGDIKAIARASKLVSNIIYSDDIDRLAGDEPSMAEPNLVTIMDPPDAHGIRHNLGLAELAARLGSIVIFDRRGEIVWMDDFESGIAQWGKGGIVGYSVDWEGDYSRNGGFSCKLTTATAVNNGVVISKEISCPPITSLGIESSFSYEQNWRDLIFEFTLYTGIDWLNGSIKYNHPGKKLQYTDADGVTQDIPGGAYTCPDHPRKFDTLKFVIDFSTVKYKRLLINKQMFDLSAFSFRSLPNAARPCLELTISLWTAANAAAIGYIDDVIITQNEP